MKNIYKTIKNTSKVYFNGSIWKSNNCGNFTIVGKTDRYIVDKRGYKEHKYYLCQFEDGTIVEAKTFEIKNGKVRNPNSPSICNKGYLGEGKWKFYVNQKATKEYVLFRGILNRCYNPNIPEYKNYGEKGVTLDSKLFNFQEFCEMLTKLPNYNNWKDDALGRWEIDKDILCEKHNIFPKIYSEKTCLFVSHGDNIKERNKRVCVTGKTYIATNPNGEKSIFTNIRDFSEKNGLSNTHVGNCIRGKAKSHRGWTFKVKEENKE